MTAIAVSEWGWPLSTHGSREVPFWVPIAPACDRWQDESSTNLRIAARIFGQAGDDDAATLKLFVDGEIPSLVVLPTIDPAYDWNATHAGALQTLGYPGSSTEIDDEHLSSACLPYIEGKVKVYADASQSADAVFLLAEIQTRYDNAYDGEPMELADYTGATFGEADAPAASFILKRLVSEACNCIGWFATYRMCVAVQEPR